MHNIDGICCHIPTSKEAACINQCHMPWARVDIQWQEIEKSKGKYTWSSIDSAIQTCLKHGLKIYAGICGTPAWMSEHVYDAPNPDDYYRFCKTVAERYKSKVDVYAIWNEPNHPMFFTCDFDDYINCCLIPGSNAIKSINSNNIIAAPDIAIDLRNWYEWVSKLKKYKSAFDIFSFHSYPNKASYLTKRYNKGEYCKLIQFFIRRYTPYKKMISKLGKPSWLTEIGWDTNKFSQDEQCLKISEIPEAKTKMKLDKVFLYVLRDAPSYAEAPFGIYDYEYKPKNAANWLKSN